MKTQAHFPNALQASAITILIIILVLMFGMGLRFLIPIIGFSATIFVSYVLAMGVAYWIISRYSKSEGDTKQFRFSTSNIIISALVIVTTVALNIGLLYPLSTVIPISDATKAALVANFSQVNFSLFLQL